MTEEVLQLSFRWTHLVGVVLWVGLAYALAWIGPRAGASAAERLALANWLRYGSLVGWLSGASLLVLMYYSGAYPYLLDGGEPPSAADWVPAFGALFGAVLLYEPAVRLGRPRAGPGREPGREPGSEAAGSDPGGAWLRGLGPVLALAGALAFAYWLEQRGFSRRAMHVHAGAFLATAMLANTWMGIAPAVGRDPGEVELRSRHNARLSIPLLLLMVSVDQPTLTGFDPWPLSLGGVLFGGWAVGLLIERGASERDPL